MRFLIRWLIGAIAVAAAVYFVPGISIVGENGWLVVIGMALILGLVNAFIRPLLTILSCGFIVLTLGLFMLVVNGLSFLFASQIAQNWFGIGFQVDGLWPAIWGAVVVSIVTFVASLILPDPAKKAVAS